MAIALQAKASCLGLVTACAAGTHSIGEAYRMIKHGYVEAMIAAAEAAFAPVCFSGFANMTALSTRTDKTGVQPRSIRKGMALLWEKAQASWVVANDFCGCCLLCPRKKTLQLLSGNTDDKRSKAALEIVSDIFPVHPARAGAMARQKCAPAFSASKT